MITQVPPESFERARALTEQLAGQSAQYGKYLQAQTDVQKSLSDARNWNIYAASLPSSQDKYIQAATGRSAADSAQAPDLSKMASSWADDSASKYLAAVEAAKAPENQKPDLSEIDPDVWKGMGVMPAPYSYKLKPGNPPTTPT